MERLSLENLFGELIDLRWEMGIDTVRFSSMLEATGLRSKLNSIYVIESNYRRREDIPSVKWLMAYARALGVDIEVRCVPTVPISRET